MECLKCCKKLLKKDVSVICCNCNLSSHASCTKLTPDELKIYLETSTPWRCRNCTKMKEEGSRSAQSKSPRSEESKRNTNQPPSRASERGMGDFKEQTSIWDKIVETKREMSRSLDNFYDKLIEGNTKLSTTRLDLQKAMDTIEALKTQNEMLNKEIETLTYRLELTEQTTRRNSLEISGISDKKGENILVLIKQIGLAIEFLVKDEMIDSCYRINRQNKSGQHAIVLIFVRRFDKDAFLKHFRKKKHLNSKDLGRKDDSKIFIRESLSFNKRQLLLEARRVAKQMHYKGVGILNGEVFIRKKEKATPTFIKELKDLDNFINVPEP